MSITFPLTALPVSSAMYSRPSIMRTVPRGITSGSTETVRSAVGIVPLFVRCTYSVPTREGCSALQIPQRLNASAIGGSLELAELDKLRLRRGGLGNRLRSFYPNGRRLRLIRNGSARSRNERDNQGDNERQNEEPLDFNKADSRPRSASCRFRHNETSLLIELSEKLFLRLKLRALVLCRSQSRLALRLDDKLAERFSYTAFLPKSFSI